MEPHLRRYRWLMLALAWLLYTVFGIVQRSVAPLVTPILKDLQISYSQMGVILGSWPLVYIVVAIMAGAIMDRWGIRKSLFAGAVIIGLSESLRYFANSFTVMLAFVALFGLGGPMISIGCPKTIAMWFSGKARGTAVGIYTTGPWIGGVIAYSMTNSVVMPFTGYSWRLTFVAFSLLVFAAALLWGCLARDVKSTEATEGTSIVKVFTSLIGVRNIQLLLIMGFLILAISHGFNNWLPNILETAGMSPTIAGFAASIPVLTSIPTVLIVPRFVAPRSRGRVVALMSFAVAISVLVVTMTSGASLIAGLLLYGIVGSCLLPFSMLMLMDTPEVGSKYMGSAGGMFFCVAEIGGFAGAFIIGAIKDLTGSFVTGAFFIAGGAVALAAVALLLKRSAAHSGT